MAFDYNPLPVGGTVRKGLAGTRSLMKFLGQTHALPRHVMTVVDSLAFTGDGA
jgi:hypothetical protein